MKLITIACCTSILVMTGKAVLTFKVFLLCFFAHVCTMNLIFMIKTLSIKTHVQMRGFFTLDKTTKQHQAINKFLESHSLALKVTIKLNLVMLLGRNYFSYL